MNILITGVNGFIGKHLLNYFSKKHPVFSISRTALQPFQNNNFAIDLSDVDLVKKLFSRNVFKQKIDIILHCAAVLSENDDNKNINVFHKNNAITESMIHIADVLNVSKFINISSIGVYPNKSGTYDEQSAIEPSMNHECLYGLSKVCSEELFKFYFKDTIQIINLRLGQVYGDGMRQDRIFEIMKHELQSNNTITVYGNGLRISNFVAIDYLKIKMEKLMNNKNAQGTFNLGEKNLSYAQLAEMIIEKYGNSSSKIILKDQGTSAQVMIDSSKINAILNNNVL